MVWYSHLFKNFPQFIVLHTVKGFDIVNKAEIDIFLEQKHVYCMGKNVFPHTVHLPNPMASSSQLQLAEGYRTQGERPAPGCALPSPPLSSGAHPATPPPAPDSVPPVGVGLARCITYISPTHCFQLWALTWFSHIFLCFLKRSLSSLLYIGVTQKLLKPQTHGPTPD